MRKKSKMSMERLELRKVWAQNARGLKEDANGLSTTKEGGLYKSR